ncbi:mapk-regulated corepressor-interacting protein 1 isoform X2 [Crotalus tigris]|uniref:mapk-regulated corepressor-interacting protein 1 isoform X2 n=1 Tax=Crotalus tigris TaxID=88082 RepID=UPI00192F5BB3|nr:mapk-regulated corepressor-interacting protein 1 isoform X2 [Crotalus tigris]
MWSVEDSSAPCRRYRMLSYRLYLHFSPPLFVDFKCLGGPLLVSRSIVAKIYAKRFYYTHLCLPVAMDFLQWTATVVGYFSVVIFHLKTEVKCFIPDFHKQTRCPVFWKKRESRFICSKHRPELQL